jgi:hypothetical protein
MRERLTGDSELGHLSGQELNAINLIATSKQRIL